MISILDKVEVKCFCGHGYAQHEPGRGVARGCVGAAYCGCLFGSVDVLLFHIHDQRQEHVRARVELRLAKIQAEAVGVSLHPFDLERGRRDVASLLDAKLERDLGKSIEQARERREHTRDEECEVDPATDLCRQCGVLHGDPCPTCGGRAFCI